MSPPSPSKIHKKIYVQDRDKKHRKSIVADIIGNKPFTMF
jgi:hypothetical protein